jgi:hypothetical protein
MNSTIELPQSSHYDPDHHLLCTPSIWSSILLFYLANYVAHLGTVRSAPGSLGITRASNMLGALLLPSTGLNLGLQQIYARAIFSTTPLEKACRARALCVVVRTPDWRPCRSHPSMPGPPQNEVGPSSKDYQTLKNIGTCFLPPKSWHDNNAREVHGKCVLPPGHALALLPRTFPILRCSKESVKASEDHSVNRELDGISMSYSFSKGVIAVFQIIYASTTLYQARGNQITRFGYAAFGLTVTPYILMSIINLLSSLLTPEFPSVYLVRDSVMDQVEARTDTVFERVVADLTIQPSLDIEVASLDSRDYVMRNRMDYPALEIPLQDFPLDATPVSCSPTIALGRSPRSRTGLGWSALCTRI